MSSRETLVLFEDPYLLYSSSSSFVSEGQKQEAPNIPKALISTQNIQDTRSIRTHDTTSTRASKKKELVVRTSTREIWTYTPESMREINSLELNIRNKTILEKSPPKKLVPTYTPIDMKHYKIEGWQSSIESIMLL